MSTIQLTNLSMRAAAAAVGDGRDGVPVRVTVADLAAVIEAAAGAALDELARISARQRAAMAPPAACVTAEDGTVVVLALELARRVEAAKGGAINPVLMGRLVTQEFSDVVRTKAGFVRYAAPSRARLDEVIAALAARL